MQNIEFGGSIGEWLVDQLYGQNRVVVAGLCKLGRQILKGCEGACDVGCIGEPFTSTAETPEYILSVKVDGEDDSTHELSKPFCDPGAPWRSIMT